MSFSTGAFSKMFAEAYSQPSDPKTQKSSEAYLTSIPEWEQGQRAGTDGSGHLFVYVIESDCHSFTAGQARPHLQRPTTKE
jgi:hypothetical protein